MGDGGSNIGIAEDVSVASGDELSLDTASLDKLLALGASEGTLNVEPGGKIRTGTSGSFIEVPTDGVYKLRAPTLGDAISFTAEGGLFPNGTSSYDAVLPRAVPQTLPTAASMGLTRDQELGFTAHYVTGVPGVALASWFGMVWSSSLSLFCAVATNNTQPTRPRVMTSPDGVTWTARTAPDHGWKAVEWAPSLGLFCAVAEGTTKVMTSPDGINWTTRAHAGTNNQFFGIAWSETLTLFVATGIGTDPVMTSPDGINWTARTPAEANGYRCVTWAPSLGIFCALSLDGTNRVMTSPDGINWTARSAASNLLWRDVAWSETLSLFAAVASDGTQATQVMTSPDGINWTSRTSAQLEPWTTIESSPTYGFCATGSSDGMISSDGITWTSMPDPFPSGHWRALAWSSDLGIFCGACDYRSDQVMTSSLWTPSISAWEIDSFPFTQYSDGATVPITIGTPLNLEAVWTWS